MDTTTAKQIGDLLGELIPLLQEEVSRLEQESSQQEPLIQRLLKTEIQKRRALILRLEEALAPAPSNGERKKLPKRLIVTLSNGIVIEHGEQWETFMEAIELAGTKRVCEEKFGTPIRPLVKRKNTDVPLEEDYRLDKSGDYGIYTTYSAEDKAEHLKRISEKFGLQWKVEVIER